MMKEFEEHYVRGLGMSARNNGMAFGYSSDRHRVLGMLSATRMAPSRF